MARLGDVCSKATSNIAQKDLDGRHGEYPIYGASGLIKTVDFYQQENPYIAVVKDGAGVGRVMKLPAKSSVIGTMQYIIPGKNVDIGYLAYAMENMNLAKYYTGATIPHIYFKDYQKEELPLPPLEEQRRIAALLDKVSDLIAKRREQMDKLDLLVKARFVEMFGGISDSKLYPYIPIDSFATVVSGGTPDRGNDEYWQGGTIPWVKTTELQNNEIYNAEEKITQSGLDNSSAKIIPANAILIAMYGQGKTRGMTGYLVKECATNQACACILPSKSMNQRFLWQYMIFSYDILRNMAKGGNQPNLNLGIIKQFPVIKPPLNMQNAFSNFMKQTSQSKLTIQQSLEKLETLKKALMQQYFG